MITLRQNLQDAILFALLDSKKYPHQECRDIASTIAPSMEKWIREYFYWYVKGSFRNEQDPAIKNKIMDFLATIYRSPDQLD